MIKANGRIQKQAYCPNCFSILTWDKTKDEYISLGHRMINCPYCKASVEVDSSFCGFIEKDVIEDPKGYVNGIAYENSIDAINSLKEGDSLLLMEDVSINTLNINGANVDLNGHTLTIANSFYPKGEVTLSNGFINTTSNIDPIVSSTGSKITLNNITINSKHNGVVSSSGSIILNDSSITAQEAAILVVDSGHVEINGGDYTTIDNGPIMTNGTSGRGNNTIIVNGGTFTGNITSAGYLAFVVYLANTDSLIVKGGTFNVTDGSAFVVRGGYLRIDSNVNISVSGTKTGKVGDGNQLIPAGYDIVIDYKSNYPAVESINVVAPNRNIHIIEA